MKHLILIRHGRKDGELIAKEQIEAIEQNGIPAIHKYIEDRNVFLHLGSAFVRTQQTINALENFLEKSGFNYLFCGYLDEEYNLGNEEMFKKFVSNAEIKTMANETNWFAAFQKYNPDFIKEVQTGALKAIRNAFEKTAEGSWTIIVAHTPIIEWLIYALDPENLYPRDIKLQELTGFVITQKDGWMRVTEPVGFTCGLGTLGTNSGE